MKSLFLLLLCFNVFASDHIDGPVTSDHAVADLSDFYAFPTPLKKDHLTVVLNAYPFVPSNGHFADKLTYDILIREATLGNKILTQSGITISCSFFTPNDHSKHKVTCKVRTGLEESAVFNEIMPEKPGAPLRVYAGQRSDPFFFNVDWSNSVGKGKLIGPMKENTMDKLNVLSLVIDIDLNALFGKSHSSVFALASQSMTTDNRRIDRIGRPEITNVSFVARGKEEIKDSYNSLPPFKPVDKKYRDRLSSNITYYDGLDGKKDWEDSKKEVLLDLILDDFLVIDLSKPCRGQDFLEIEKAIVEGRVNQSCGGRGLGDDIMDILFGYYITAGQGTVVSDGVAAPYRAPLKTFPYVAEPDNSTGARMKAFAARNLFSL